jgi:hypothetical protein
MYIYSNYFRVVSGCMIVRNAAAIAPWTRERR